MYSFLIWQFGEVQSQAGKEAPEKKEGAVIAHTPLKKTKKPTHLDAKMSREITAA